MGWVVPSVVRGAGGSRVPIGGGGRAGGTSARSGRIGRAVDEGAGVGGRGFQERWGLPSRPGRRCFAGPPALRCSGRFRKAPRRGFIGGGRLCGAGHAAVATRLLGAEASAAIPASAGGDYGIRGAKRDPGRAGAAAISGIDSAAGLGVGRGTGGPPVYRLRRWPRPRRRSPGSAAAGRRNGRRGCRPPTAPWHRGFPPCRWRGGGRA